MDEESSTFRKFLIAGICVVVSLMIGLLLSIITAGFLNIWLVTAVLSFASLAATFLYGGMGSDDEF